MFINKKENIFNDNIAYIEQYNFSKANLNEENRIQAITLIASVCYQNPKALNSDSLYNRLLAESKGLPSSSFEFVPVFISFEDLDKIEQTSSIDDIEKMSIFKYGEILDSSKGLLTNFRAIIYDVENKRLSENWLKHFNTEEECKIIAKHFKVFKAHIDLPTFGQMVRHRVNWQVLSRRYVSGIKTPFEFYVSEKMKNIISVMEDNNAISACSGSNLEFSTKDVLDICLNHYFKALKDGVKPEEARRIIPQACYTTAWCSFQPTQLDNFFKLRLDSHAQKEIRLVAEAMKELIGE